MPMESTGPPELELQAVLSLLEWALGTELQYSEEQVLLTAELFFRSL